MLAIPGHPQEDQVVVAALVGDHWVLLHRNLLEKFPLWKLMSETVEPGESVLHALISCLSEEGGLTKKYGVKDIETRINDKGILEITDARIKVHQIGEPQRLKSRKGGHHWRHFFIVKTSDDLILSLSGKTLRADDDELIRTKAFQLRDLDALGSQLLRPHAELIRAIPNKKITLIEHA